MNFEEIQVLWQSHEQKPLYAIDHVSMSALVRRKTERIKRYIDRFEWSMIGVALATALILPVDAWREGGGWHQYLVAGVSAIFGFNVLTSRIGRMRNQVQFDESLKGILERSIGRIDRHLSGLTLMYWGFHLPVAIVGAIGLTFYSNAWSPFIWGGVLIVSALSYWGTRQDARRKIVERGELSVLLDKLNSNPAQTEDM